MDLDRFQDRFAAAPGSGEEVKVTLKWFDPIKGFGFVSDGTEKDIFLHASAVQRAGNPALYPGAELTCEVGDAQRGKQVVRVIEIHSVGDPNAVEDRGGGRGGDRGPRRDFGERPPRRDFGDRDGGFRSDRGPRRAPQQAQPYIPDGSEKEINGTIKWFKPQSGFGFAAPADGGNDVFVHRSALSRSNLMPEDMQPGTNIKMLVRQAEKGLEAVQVEIGN